MGNEYLGLSNRKIGALINKDNGQLVSLAKNGVEYIHPGGRNKTDPLRNTEGWSNSNIVMFPIVSASKNNHIIYNDAQSPLDQHGIVRALKPNVIKHVDENGLETIVVDYSYTKNTIVNNYERFKKNNTLPLEESLPFGFDMSIGYILSDNILNISTVIANNSDKDFCYAFGMHPAFNTHLQDLEKGYFFNKEGNPLLHFKDGKDSPMTVKDLIEISKTNAKFLNEENYVLFYNEEEDSLIELTATLGNIMLWSPSKNMFCMEPITEKAERGTAIDLSPNGTYKNILPAGETKHYFTNIRIE